MFKRVYKTLITSILLLFFSSSLFAVEEYISRIYKQLDQVFIIKSDKDLNEILSNNSTDKYYYLIENYTEKKIRRLIVNNDYDFAMTAIIIVIENNLDNERAVEMYSVISEAYEIQQKHEAELEHQRQLELARIELEKEKQRGNAEKEFVSAAKAEGGSVFVSGKETKLTSYNWKAVFGIADLLYLKDVPGDINSLHYGISADGRYEYSLDKKMVIGGDLFAGFQFLGIAPEEKLVPVLGEVTGAVKLAVPVISKDLFFRAGFSWLMAAKSKTAMDTTEVVGSFFSPMIGVKMERIPVGPVKIDIGADWLAGHLFLNNIKFAMGADANIEIPFVELERVKLNVNIGLRDKILLKDSGVENRASVILAIGAENVIK